MKRFTTIPRAAKAALMVMMVVGLSACSIDRLLDVNNPDEIDEGALNDPALVDVLVSGVIGDFQAAYDDPFVWRASMFTDMQITGINWEQTARLSQRIVSFDEGDADGMFSQLSLARQQADSVSGLLRQLLETPASDARLAKTLAYAGYSYTILADAMCRATVNQQAEIHDPLALYAFAVTRFTEAAQIATAAGDDDIFNLAQVGLSRANLNLGNNAAAITAANLVPDDFMYWAEYSSSDSRVYNVLEGRESGSNHSLGMHPVFLAGGGRPEEFGNQDLEAFLTDPRIQHTPSWTFGHNVLTKLYKPSQGLLHSDYNGERFSDGGDPPLFARGTDIAFASGLEARHNKWEATGATAETLTFINERRAVGNQGDAGALTGAAMMTELHDQRGRDLFLAGNRLGDLRRWLRGGEDLFPSGTHPTTQWGAYGTATCFPMPLEECEGNPNLVIADCGNP